MNPQSRGLKAEVSLCPLNENVQFVSLCEDLCHDLDVTQNASEKASAGGKYTTAAAR